MARPRNMTINGHAVKSVKINGQLWWRKSTEAVEWRLEGTDNLYFSYNDYIDEKHLTLQVVNTTSDKSDSDYMIITRQGYPPEELDVYFEGEECYIELNSWPRESLFELIFTEPEGRYEYFFEIRFEGIECYLSPASTQYNIPTNTFSESDFVLNSTVPISEYYIPSDYMDYFNLYQVGSNGNNTQLYLHIEQGPLCYTLSNYGSAMTIPVYVSNESGQEYMIELLIELLNEPENIEHTYEIIENDTVYGAYRGDYWDATIYYLIQKDGYTVDQGEQYYSKPTHGQTPPFTDTYSIGVTVYDPDSGEDKYLYLTGTAYIDY